MKFWQLWKSRKDKDTVISGNVMQLGAFGIKISRVRRFFCASLLIFVKD